MLMNRSQFKTLLETLNVQVFYNHTTKNDVVNFPFIVMVDSSNSSLYADDTTYFETTPYTIILHTIDRDDTLETRIKTLFTTNKIPYQVNDIRWIEELLMWQVSFVCEV